MKRRRAVRYLKQKSFIIVLMICFVSAVALTGLYRYGNQTKEDNLVDLNEMESDTNNEDVKEEASTGNVTANNFKDSEEVTESQTELETPDKNVTSNNVTAENIGQTTPVQNLPETVQETAPAVVENEQIAEPVAQEQPAVETKADVVTYNLKDSDKLNWPVEGNVLLNFNMDNTIYFATLNQYKCNPAIIIQSEVGTPVKAAANGKIESIETMAETGSTIVMDLGNGYKATYGQLKNIKFKVGDIVAKGQTIASVSDTTKYYTVEGNNLYFKVTKDDKPINPMNFLQ